MESSEWQSNFLMLYLTGGVSLVGGAALVIYNVRSLVNFRRRIKTLARASGLITKLDRRRLRLNSLPSELTYVYFPTIRFQTASGQTLEFEFAQGTTPAAGKVGETVTVLYDASRPRDARVESFMTLWFRYLVAFIIGGAAMLFGAFTLIFIALIHTMLSRVH